MRILAVGQRPQDRKDQALKVRNGRQEFPGKGLRMLASFAAEACAWRSRFHSRVRLTSGERVHPGKSQVA